MSEVILFFKSHIKGFTRDNTYFREHYRRAAKFAAAKHKGQTRKDGKTPYITHPIQVATILSKEAHENDPVIILGALLHDTIEDTNTSFEELVQEFGKEVAELVLEVTNDPRLSKQENKAAQVAKQWSPRAIKLKMADKTANLRDLVNAPPVGMPKDKKIEYANHARKVIESMREHPEALKRLFDLAYQRVLNH
ncbi:HD domain-containing protein [Nitrosomonas sp.]|uniref:HD domain-containing protein n=1 Tax=Nitrosomonas sp. TaxID=42353 RepID=UPI00248E9AAE|nr:MULTISPECIES: HD domain-containing protein [Nitrosomonas]MCW5602615.1 HD domain-containing protein [Nitrosomonas sp.]